MNLIEAAQEYLDNIDNGAQYFYTERYDNYRYKFDRSDILIQQHDDEEWTSYDIELLIRDFKNNDWQVHYAEPKLKPCPFCGKSYFSLICATNPYLRCDECAAIGPSGNGSKEAITAWNRRDGEEK